MDAQSQNNCKHQEWRVRLLRVSAGFLSVVFHMLHEFSSCARDKLHRQRALRRAPRQMTPQRITSHDASLPRERRDDILTV